MATFIDSDELLDNIHAAINNAEQYMLHETNLAPVVHAHWIVNMFPAYEHVECSHCKEQYYENDLYLGGNDFPKYCPNCGAKMDEEVSK